MSKYHFNCLLLLVLITFGSLTTAYSAIKPRILLANASSTSRIVHPKVGVYKFLKLISRASKFRKSKTDNDKLKMAFLSVFLIFVLSIVFGVWAINLFLASKILLGIVVLLASLAGLSYSLSILGPPIYALISY